MDLMTAKEAAEFGGISQRRVQVLCDNGRVCGAERPGNDMWVIPSGTPKPLDGRTKTAKQRHNPGIMSRDVERLIGEVNGTMAIEGMPLTDEDKERLRLVLRGKVTADEMVQRLAEKYCTKGEKMNNYSLELHFDADSSERIGNLIRTVADTCGNDYMLRRNIPFHLTLAYFEAEDTSAAINISEKIAAENSANAESIAVVKCDPYGATISEYRFAL
jgi:hypothetical protein